MARLVGREAIFMAYELEKIAQAAEAAPQAAASAADGGGEMQGAVQQGASEGQEASPAHGVVAARIEQLTDKKARGIPVIQPPPGYVYAPDLQAFTPREGDPAWMLAQQAAEAAKAKAYYVKGRQDAETIQAQQETDMKVQQATQAALQNQQVARAQQQARIAEAARSESILQKQLRERKRAQEGIAPPTPRARATQATAAPPAQRGVTIQMGR